MRTFQAAIFTISRVAAALSCVMLVGMVVHILYEIVLRVFFSSSTYVLDEFVGYEVAACTFLALGYSLEHGSLIRVSLLVERLSGRARRMLDALCAIAALSITSLLIKYYWLNVERSWMRNRVSSSIAEVPLWIPEAVVLIGMLVFWLQLFAYFLRQLTGEPSPVASSHDPRHEI